MSLVSPDWASDEELLAAYVQDKNVAAFDAIYLRHSQAIFTFHLLRWPQDAHDLTLQTNRRTAFASGWCLLDSRNWLAEFKHGFNFGRTGLRHLGKVAH